MSPDKQTFLDRAHNFAVTAADRLKQKKISNGDLEDIEADLLTAIANLRKAKACR